MAYNETTGGGGGLGVVLLAPSVELTSGIVNANDASGSSLDQYNTFFVSFKDADPQLFTDTALDARVELLRYRMGKGKRWSSSVAGRVKKPKGWTHPVHMIDNAGTPDYDPEYAGSRFRKARQYYAGNLIERPTEWSMIGLNPTSKIQIDFHKWFKSGTLSIPNWHTGNPSSVMAYVATGTGRKINSLRTKPEFLNHGYSAYATNMPFARFKFRISIKDPNGTYGERITGPESEVVTVRSYPHPVKWDDINGEWTDVTNSGIKVTLMGNTRW